MNLDFTPNNAFRCILTWKRFIKNIVCLFLVRERNFANVLRMYLCIYLIDKKKFTIRFLTSIYIYTHIYTHTHTGAGHIIRISSKS